MGKSINVKVGQGRGYKCGGYMLRLRRTGYDKLWGYIKTPVDGSFTACGSHVVSLKLGNLTFRVSLALLRERDTTSRLSALAAGRVSATRTNRLRYWAWLFEPAFVPGPKKI